MAQWLVHWIHDREVVGSTRLVHHQVTTLGNFQLIDNCSVEGILKIGQKLVFTVCKKT